MPIISETERGYKRFLPQSPQEAEEKGPGVFDVVQAAFETENTVVNFAANGFSFGEDFAPEENYNPFDEDIKGYELYADSFIESRSRAQTEGIKNKVTQERMNREILANGGATSVVATIAAGVTAVVLMMVAASVTSAAGAIFKTYLYAYATGRTVPANVDTSQFSDAFRPRG